MLLGHCHVFITELTVGTGSGLTLDITDPGEVSGVNETPSNHGSNYTTASGLDTVGGSGFGLQVDIIAIPASAVGTVSEKTYPDGGYLVPGTGYTGGTRVATTTNGSGTGLTVDITRSSGIWVASEARSRCRSRNRKRGCDSRCRKIISRK